MNNFTESLKSKKLFLTGGTGLFGKWLLAALKDKFADIVILSRNPARFKKTFPLARTMGVKFIQGDIRSFEFPNDNFDYCIHGATPVVSGVHNIDQELEQQSIIIEGTRRVLELAKISNTGRLLYISSGAVYGVQPFDIKSLPETFSCNPVSLYGKAKLQAEKLCMDSNVDCVIARCFSFVGPSHACKFALRCRKLYTGMFIWQGDRNKWEWEVTKVLYVFKRFSRMVNSDHADWANKRKI